MRIRILITCLLAFLWNAFVQALPTLNYDDPYRMYTTFYPTQILNMQCKEYLKSGEMYNNDRFFFSISTFANKATYARNENKDVVRLGNVHGALGMIPLMYGSVPTGATQPPLLTTAATKTFANPPLVGVSIANPTYADPHHKFGFFSAPLKYQKAGLRFQISVRPFSDIVVTLQGGVADLRQTITGLDDQTSVAVAADVYPINAGITANQFATDQTTVENFLMEPSKQIFDQLGVYTGGTQKTGTEDVSVQIMWRHNFPVNRDADPEDWAYFIFTPYLQIGGIFGAAKKKDPDKLFDLCLGNNGHNALQISGGMDFDFTETIDIVWEAGITHFFEKNYLTRVPTHDLQFMLFPYKTTIHSSPGNTWYISFGMYAYQFLSKLSVYAQYMYLNHLSDTITLVTPDTAFKPDRLEEDTFFKVQIANLGFNYDISPNFSLGLGLQLPLARRAAYKTQVILLNASLTF